MKENQFQKQVKKTLEDQGAFIINVHGHGWQKAGLPDLQVIHQRWKGWLELKVEKGKPSVLQRCVATKIELRGVPVYVLRCVEVDSEIYGIYKYYQLENFQGKIIERFENLSSLLNLLIKLSKPKLYCEYLHEGEQPTGDAETCKKQCIDYTRNNCRKEWDKNELKEKN